MKVKAEQTLTNLKLHFQHLMDHVRIVLPAIEEVEALQDDDDLDPESLGCRMGRLMMLINAMREDVEARIKLLG